MSVRRLAEPALQPPSFAFTGEREREVQTWLAKYPSTRKQSAIIPLLMLAQEQEGWVTKAAIESVADMLGMPYIRALEVATFYTQFQLKPVGTRAHVQVCGTTPCMLRGAEALMEVCRSKIHHDQFHPNEGGTLSWEEVECLGACVNAPMVMIFKDTYEDLTPERLAEIIDAFEAGRGEEVKPGPQNGRFYSVPATGLTTLTDETAVLKSTRDREREQAAATAPEAEEPAGPATVAPSNAGRPKTAAEETNPTLKTPSPVKTSPQAEAAASVPAPGHSETNANKTEPASEGEVRQRKPQVTKTEAVPAIGAPGVAERPAAGSPSDERPPLGSADRPAAIERPSKPDNLQLISGVGPKIESTLHSLGIYTFAQIASWTEAERMWMDGYLRFKGRINREDWVRQAQALATGGVEEYARVFGRKPV